MRVLVMGQHVWVRHTILPITLTEFIGNPVEGEVWFQYSYTEEALTASEDEAAYGCDLCGTPLIPLTVSTVCTGVPDDVSELTQT